MGSAPRVICGHLERGGHQGTEICEARADHPGDHVMVPFEMWVREELTWHHKANRAIPHWLWTIAEEARRFGAEQLWQALEEDRERRRRPDPEGSILGSRVERDDRWRRTAETGGDWRSPDSTSRSVRPDQPGEVPPGVQGIPVTGRTRGEGMATVAEIKAQAGAINARLEEARAAIKYAIEIFGTEQQAAAVMLAESGHDAASAALARMREAEGMCDDAIALSLAATEQLDTYSANL